MMSVEEWRKVDRMTWEEWLQWCASLGLPEDFTSERKSYQHRLKLIVRLQAEGKGPGAYTEREVFEAKKRHDAQGLDFNTALRQMNAGYYARRNR